MAHKYKLGDYLKDVNLKKENLLRIDPEARKGLSMFIVNRITSLHAENIAVASLLNQMQNIDDGMKYDFLIHGLRKGSRFARLPKTEKLEHIEVIKEHYNVGERQAREILRLLKPEDIKVIIEGQQIGGNTK